MSQQIQSKRYVADEPDSPGHTPVYVVDGDGRRELDKRLDLANHSPDGFSWGHGESGPAQLALAILADARGDDVAIQNYQEFKWVVIASTPADEPLSVTESEIDSVVGDS